MRRLVFQVLGSLFVAAAARGADFVGPSKCTGCHEHQRQTAQWKSQEPRILGKKAHFNAMKRLDEPAAKKYAAAVGLSDPFEIKGSRTCVKCHATVYKGDANSGVSCESCHGAASGYLDIHQVKGNYAKSVTAGMRDLREKPPMIASRCAECHAVKDGDLIAAGHPTGEEFKGGDRLQKLVHWDTQYNFSQITSAYAAAAGRVTRVAAQATATSTTQTASSRPLTPTANPRSSRTEAPQDFEDLLRRSNPPPLPDNYQPPPLSRTVRVTPPPPEKVTSPPRTPPQKTPPRLERKPAAEPVDTEPTLPPRPLAPGAQLRADAFMLLDRLLKNGSRLGSFKPPAAPLEYSGPDGELYRIQDEAVVLALEALRNRK